MTAIYIDADACPVKNEIYRVAERYSLKVYVVSNSYLGVPRDPSVELVVVSDSFDAADNWIAERAGPGDIVITADIPLADRSLKAGASVIGNTGVPFTNASIGMAMASRELMSNLRAMGEITGGPKPMSQRDRSRFLSALDETVQKLRRAARLTEYRQQVIKLSRWGKTMKLLRTAALALAGWLGSLAAAEAADLNVYTIWPENYARPMFQEFEKQTGMKVNFLRFSSGEALARVIAEKNNPRIDVLFGGPVETFAAGIKEGIFETLQVAVLRQAAGALQAGRRPVDGDRRRSAGLHDQRGLPQDQQPAAAGLLGRPPEPGLQEQPANGRRAHLGHGGDAHLLGAGGLRPQRGQGLRLPEEAASERAGLYQERRRRDLADRAWPGRGRHLLHRRRARDQGQGL